MNAICAVWEGTTGWVRSFDAIYKPSHSRWHFESEKGQKTMLGGFITMLIQTYLCYVIYSKGLQMLGLENPRINSLEKEMNTAELGGGVGLDVLSKLYFEVNE